MVAFLYYPFVSGSVEYPMPYASCLVSCSVVWRCSLQLSRSWCTFLKGALACSDVSTLRELCLSANLGFCSLFYLGYIHIALWDSLSGLCALWDGLSSFPGLLLGNCILEWPVWPVIGYPLLGVHPSISMVRLIVIGYHCNHLDGQLNYWASAHWLTSVTTTYQLCNWWLCHSTIGTVHRIWFSTANETCESRKVLSTDSHPTMETTSTKR